MNQQETMLGRFERAAQFLPEDLRRAAMRCDLELQQKAEEFRLRQGQPMTLVCSGREYSLPTKTMDKEIFRKVMDSATQCSAYCCADSIAQGFLPLEGGFRLGICGKAVIKQQQIATICDISSLSLRIAKEALQAGEKVYPELFEGEKFRSTLIISPPGGGKTTLLRDLVRRLSEGDEKHCPMRLCVVDERGEIAADHHGVHQFDVGPHTDVMTNTGKSEGITMLLRAMNPEIIALDEITASKDLQAMTEAVNCGAAFLATVHGVDRKEIENRKVCAELLKTGIFSRFVILTREKGKRQCRVEKC